MKLKQLKEWVHQLVTESDYKVIKEIQLGETTVRLSTSTDANFHNNIVQLVSNNGRIALDKKDMRALLNYIKTIMGYSYMPRLKKEGKLTEKDLSKIFEGDTDKKVDTKIVAQRVVKNFKGQYTWVGKAWVKELLRKYPKGISQTDFIIDAENLKNTFGGHTGGDDIFKGLNEGIVMEGKMVKLPSGLKAELDTFKGLTLFTRQGKPIKFDRKELAMFLRSVGKHMGVR